MYVNCIRMERECSKKEVSEREREKKKKTVHGDDVAGRTVGERAIARYRALEALDDHRTTPIPFSTARIFAEIPICLPQLNPNLSQCPHCKTQSSMNSIQWS